MAARYEHAIPEGYEAKIEGNKVIFELKESEDERIRKALIHLINEQNGFLTAINGISVKDIIAYLERQKEQKPLSTKETELNSIAFLEQLGYTCVPPGAEQKPAEWSEEDEDKVDDICKLIEHATIIPRSGDDDTGIPPTRLNDKYKGELKAFVKSLRNCPTKSDTWKPSEEQPEVDLEKELDSLITPELKKYKALPSMMDVAKHFYELGLNARKEEC